MEKGEEVVRRAKLCDPEFKTVYMERGEKAMANHWGIIQEACSKWHGIIEEVAARPESGADVERQVTPFQSPPWIVRSSSADLFFSGTPTDGTDV